MKTSNNLKGLHHAITMTSSQRRSIPEVQSSSSLVLYKCEIEKERLMNECIKLRTRYQQISRRVEEITQKVKRIHEDALKAVCTGTILDSNTPEEKATENELKKMSFEY